MKCLHEPHWFNRRKYVFGKCQKYDTIAAISGHAWIRHNRSAGLKIEIDRPCQHFVERVEE